MGVRGDAVSDTRTPCPCSACKGGGRGEQGYCGCACCRAAGVPILCLRRCGALAAPLPGLEAPERLCPVHGVEWLAHIQSLHQPWLSRYPRFLEWLNVQG